MYRQGIAPGWLVLSIQALLACSSNSAGGGGGGGGGGATCATTTLVATPGLEGCFACMAANCCAALQTCDGDPTCVYCQSAEGRVDTARCVDSNTFQLYAPAQALATCQDQNCVSACGAPGNLCTPANCNAMCSNFSRGCQ